jgi:hypothetical protein
VQSHIYDKRPHILGSHSSYMTLHPIPSEFPYISEENLVFFFIIASSKTNYNFQAKFLTYRPFSDSISLTMNCLEDCLYLNIWVPASVLESSPLSPVLTWIYGGTSVLTTHQRESGRAKSRG